MDTLQLNLSPRYVESPNDASETPRLFVFASPKNETPKIEIVFPNQVPGTGESKLEDLLHEYQNDQLVAMLNAASEPLLEVPTAAKELQRRIAGGNVETLTSVISTGGIPGLVEQARTNMGDASAMLNSLDALEIFSREDRLKMNLGVHKVVELILDCMRAHSEELVLVKCCSVLSNLTFNNFHNIESVVKSGGVPEIVRVISEMESSRLDQVATCLLCNICYDSVENKLAVGSAGGVEANFKVMARHSDCINPGDVGPSVDTLVVSLRLLANLAYIPENMEQIMAHGGVETAKNAMEKIVSSVEAIEIGVIAFGNLSWHGQAAEQMVELGVMDLIKTCSAAHPTVVSLQQACIGCFGNMVSEGDNSMAFLERGGHTRVFEIMEELIFDDSILIMSLQLLKVLAINREVAVRLVSEDVVIHIGCLLGQTKQRDAVTRHAWQALCKLLADIEAAKVVSREDTWYMLLDIAKAHCENPEVFVEIIRVWVNMADVEDNAQPIAKVCIVDILRSIEQNAHDLMFLEMVALLLTKLSVHRTCIRHIVKHGGIAVIADSMEKNMEKASVLSRYIRTLSNLMFFQEKVTEKVLKGGVDDVVERAANEHADNEPLQEAFASFNRSVRMTSRAFAPSKVPLGDHQIRGQLDEVNRMTLMSGAHMVMYAMDGTQRDVHVKLNDECTMLQVDDHQSVRSKVSLPRQTSDQFSIRAVKTIGVGVGTSGLLENANPRKCFTLTTSNNISRKIVLALEARTDADAIKWVNALRQVHMLNKAVYETLMEMRGQDAEDN